MSKNKNGKKGKGGDDSDEGQFEEKGVDYEFKIILVGSAEVGKTSITNRFTKDNFNPEQQHTRQVEIMYHQYEIPNSNEIARLHIWDTLGQEKFKSISQLFFNGTAGAFVVFDLSRAETFDEIPEWHNNLVQTCTEGVVITIVGNKCDLPRNIDYDKAAKFAQDNNCNYMEVSAFSGHNIKSMFQNMVQEVHKKVSGQKGSNSLPDKQKNGVSVLGAPKELGGKKKKGCKC